MSQRELEPLQRGRLSLSVRVSMGLVLAAIIPLIIVVIFSEFQARPELLAQAQTQMESDAKSRTQLIDTYFNERMLDTLTGTQVPTLQGFTTLPQPPQTPPAIYDDAANHTLLALAAGKLRDPNYTIWSLFNAQGNLLLTYPVATPPTRHGTYVIPPENQRMLTAGKTFISAVYYSPTTQKASVDIYSPIIAADKQYLGFIRASLNLDYIWGIVQEDLGKNGKNSYAFILDEQGIRIADTNANRRFTGVAPVGSDVQQTISQEQRFGTTNPIQVRADPSIADSLHHGAQQMDFQAQPAEQGEQYQIVRRATTSVPWNYFVLSPVSTVTAEANQQLIAAALVAFIVSLVAAFVGLFSGRGITRPILTSVDSLLSSSEALSTLATRQQDAASEQMWVVDSSQIGLQSVQYYSEATAVAARQLSKIAGQLQQRWGTIYPQEARESLGRIVQAAQYIENAAQHQNASAQKLSTALKVATQVTEQLVDGTSSATEAAAQLEGVVRQLRAVVGK